MDAAKDYTQDGTVHLHGRPALASKTGRWRACSFLVGYEAFERMAFNGIASNLVNYLTTQLHEDTLSSVRNVNNWSGAVWITPILGAYIADSYLGRFWTFTVSSLIYVLNLVVGIAADWSPVTQQPKQTFGLADGNRKRKLSLESCEGKERKRGNAERERITGEA